MKIKEIVNEAYKGFHGHLKDFGLTRGEVDSALPNARINPEVRNTDTYMQGRYGIALAAAAAQQNGEQFEQESPWAENFGTIAYTEEEINIIKNAEKLMGISGISLTKKSSEKSDVNVKSPVADNSWRKTGK